MKYSIIPASKQNLQWSVDSYYFFSESPKHVLIFDVGVCICFLLSTQFSSAVSSFLFRIFKTFYDICHRSLFLSSHDYNIVIRSVIMKALAYQADPSSVPVFFCKLSLDTKIWYKLKFSIYSLDLGTLSKKNDIIWEFFPNVGPPPPFGNPLSKKNF